MRVELDFSRAEGQLAGAREGGGRGDLGRLSTRVAALHDDLVSAGAEGHLPHLQAAMPGRAREWAGVGGAWARGRGRTERVVVVGEPAAVAAAMVMAGPQAPGILAAPGLDPELLAAAIEAPGRARLVVLDGPPWVRELAVALAPRVSRVTIFRGDGAPGPPWTLPGAELVDHPGSSDPRFGVVGGAAFALLGFAGVDIAPVEGALHAMARRCDSRALLQNPAYKLAAVLHSIEDRQARSGVAILLGPASLLGWSRWVSATWAAVGCKRVVDPSGAWRNRGGKPMVALVGDESTVQRLLEGPPLALVLAVQAERLAADVQVGEEGWLSDRARRLMGLQVGLLVAQRLPVVLVRLPDTSPAARAASAYLFLQAALVASALDGGDPLRMDAADQWRGWLDAALEPGSAVG